MKNKGRDRRETDSERERGRIDVKNANFSGTFFSLNRFCEGRDRFDEDLSEARASKRELEGRAVVLGSNTGAGNLWQINYGRDISRGIISRQKSGRVEIEIGEASPTF